jgi:uncharacterized repeat protein (TIGR03803 family)
MLHKHPKMQCSLARRIFGRNGHGSRLGNFCWALAFVVLSGRIAPQVFAAEMQLQILHEFFPGPTNIAVGVGRPVELQPGEFYGAASTNLGSVDERGAVFKVTSRGVVALLAALDPDQSPSWSRIRGLKQITADSLYGLVRTFSGLQLIRFRPNALPALQILGEDLGSVGPLTWDGVANFYAVTYNGGAHGIGSVLRIATNGTSTVLHSFNGTNGAHSFAALVFGPDGHLYGTTEYGGVGFTGAYSGFGTIFRITTNGLLTTLTSFGGTNGANPTGGVSLGTGGDMFGTTRGGGDFGFGTVFRVTLEGSFVTLASFDGTNGAGPSEITRGIDGNFYGLASYGGIATTNSFSGSFGTAYSVSTNGSVNVIARFDGTNALNPVAHEGLLLAKDGNLYGFAADLNLKLSLNGNAGIFFRIAQAPRVTSLSRSNGNVNLEWTAFTNGVYRVERRASLDMGGWTGLETNIISTGAIARFTDPSPMPAANYYRVVLLP